MCGIFGFSGKPGKKANLKKLQALGLYNVQRGTDSCGYYYNGNIVKGVDEHANFSKFIVDNKFTPGDLDTEVFMGHTRKSTSGKNTADNAHPHQINNYVQTHNGVIKNPWALCNKYGINHSTITVDSIGLAMNIEKNGFHVLNEYEGYAALSMTFMDDPKSLYLYHGASREKTGGTVFEERPLYILEAPEGIYYSSLQESLDFITEGKKRSYILPHNIVYKIVDGVFTEFEYEIKREDMNISNVTYYGGYGTHYNNDFPFSNFSSPSEKKTTAPTLFGDGATSTSPNILRETLPYETRIQDIYFHRGRFYRDNAILLNGEYVIDRDGNVVDDGDTKARIPETFYFYRGVMMKNKTAYDNYLKLVHKDLNVNFAYFISKYAKYAVTCLEDEGVHINADLKAKWYLNEKTFDGTFKTKFSKRVYHIRYGSLTKIGGTFDGESIYLKDNEQPSKSFVDDIDDHEKDVALDIIISTINDWANKSLKKSDVTNIPEVFLMFLDYWNAGFAAADATDKQIEKETAVVVKDLYSIGYTFKEYLIQLRDTDILCDEQIKQCFKHYITEELLEFENRYVLDESDLDDAEKIDAFNSFIEVEDIIDQSEELDNSKEIELEVIEESPFDEDTCMQQGIEYLEDAADQLSEMEDLADELQLLEADVFQNIAYKIYKEVAQLKKNFLEELENSKKEEYKKVIQKLNTIRIC